MSKTTKTAKKATTAKKASAKPTVMTYPQVKALTNALSHSHLTKAQLSEMLDGVNTNGKGMDKDKKAEWLSAHGSEPATYKQCLAYAMILFKGKTSYEEVSNAIEALDKKNGYVRQPKVAKVVEEANKNASEAKPEQPSLLEGLTDQPQA